VGLLNSLSDAIGGTTGRDDVFTYRCMSCEAEFDLPKTRMIGVRCPDCQSMDVRDAAEV
jgi:Zn finger protein HypA/HybF involved in hydrogenase expression